MTKAATLMPINDSRMTRLFSCHGRANNHGFPFDSRTFQRVSQCDFFVSRISNPCSREMLFLFRDKDSERMLLKAEFYRAIADQFTIKLYRHSLVAFHPQPGGLKI